ncbi:MAG: hypothetical protein HIU84_10100 [Acidobacteria bacterium]|nr:hypothetical protein [Acidobacteriota bacterium]
MTNYPAVPDQSDQIRAIRDRVTRYESARLTGNQRDTMHAGICEAVIAAEPSSVREAVAWMTIVTGFIADVAPTSGGSLDVYLTDAMISHWVSTSALAGRPRHTLKTRRGVLNRILRAHRGVASDTSSDLARRTSVCPLGGAQIAALLVGCHSDSRSALRGFVAHVAAGVPVGTPAVRFNVSSLASGEQNWPISPTECDLADLEGDRVIEDDWEALKDVANELGIALSPTVATQTYRFLAVTDERMSLAQRLVHYGLTEPAVTAVARQLGPIDCAGWESAKFWLRDGRVAGECAQWETSAHSRRPRTRGSEEDDQALTRKTSRAAAKRLATEYATAAAARRLRAEPIADYLASFVPDHDDEVWDSIAEKVRGTVTACQFVSIETARKHAVTLAAFLRWRASEGYSTEIASSLTFAVVDAFYLHGMPDLSARSRRDYRSRLRHLAEKGNASVKAPPSLKLGHNQVNPGYIDREERELRRVALVQTDPEVRRRLCAIVGLCAGAGLSSTEIRAACRCDISIDDDGTITVSVGGDRLRRTVVRREYERHVMAAIDGLAPKQSLLPQLKSASPITAILKGADLHEGCPSIDTRRLRTTWICWLMRQRVPLQLAFAASGLQSARTFYDMLEHLPNLVSLGDLRDGGAK